MHFAGILLALGAAVPSGSTQNTENFVVYAPSAAVAERAAEAAEAHRRELARQWLGRELPRWQDRCVIEIDLRPPRPTGRTFFTFRGSRIANLRITLRGSLEDVLEGVLPHELTHAVFATHFGRALPRWADEGAATLSEGRRQRSRQRRLAADWLAGPRRIPLSSLISMNDYPADLSRMTAIYLQGFSLVDFLVEQKGRQAFTSFLQTGYAHGWSTAVKQTYGDPSLTELEQRWKSWASGEDNPTAEANSPTPEPTPKDNPADPPSGRWVHNHSRKTEAPALQPA